MVAEVPDQREHGQFTEAQSGEHRRLWASRNMKQPCKPRLWDLGMEPDSSGWEARTWLYHVTGC